MSNTNNEDYSSIEKKITWSLIVGGVLILIVFGMYFYNFNGDLNTDPEKWGPFGDFIGGTLNPILAALAFYWLTASIRLQIQELRETKLELKKAAQAQEESAKHQSQLAKYERLNIRAQRRLLSIQEKSYKSQYDANIRQQEQIASKNYENLFFELLKLKNEALINIKFNFETIEFPHLDFQLENEVKESSGIDGLFQYLSLYKKHYKGTWAEYYEKNMINYFEKYLKMCTLLLENIYNHNLDRENYEFSKNKYIEILKTTFSQWEYEILFYHYLEYSDPEINNILECFSFFELINVDLVNNNSDSNPLVSRAYKYKENVFGSNPLWSQYFSSIDRSKEISEENYWEMLDLMSKIDLVICKNELVVNKDKGLVREVCSYKINELFENYTVDKIFTEDAFELLQWDSNLKIEKKNREVIKYLGLIDKYHGFKDNALLEEDFEKKKYKKFQVNNEDYDVYYNLNELDSIISVYEKTRKKVADEFYDLMSLKKEIFKSEDAYAALAILKYRISDKRFFQE